MAKFKSLTARVSLSRFAWRMSGLFLFVLAAAASAAERTPPVPERRPDAPALPVPRAAAETDGTAPRTRVQGRSGFFERLPPRADRTVEERTHLAAELRGVYSQPASEWPAPHVDAGVAWRELGLLSKPAISDDEPRAKARISLGRLLFFDPRLSATGEMACASCHDPELAWADARTVSFGLHRRVLKRNAPSIMNAGLMGVLFWDGRAASLEEQALQVMSNPNEMGSSQALLDERIAVEPEYRQAFAEAFGDDTVTAERVAGAIAAVERTVVGGRSRFDAFLKGKPEALSDAAVLGLDLFRREARCINCHHGPLLTDGLFHDVGLSYYGRRYEDLGRHGVTGKPDDVGRFRTPSLRNVSATRPYMHNGLFELTGVLNMYNAGMPTLTPKPDQVADPLFPKQKSPLLRPLGLNRQDLSDLEEFLKSLEEPRLRARPPRLPGDPQAASGDVPPSVSTEPATR